MDTAFVLRIPEAEPAIARWRELHDPSAAEGMPAHVTLVYPFRAWNEIDAAAEEALAHLFGRAHPIELTFRATRRFPQVIWLAPEPPEPVVALVRALTLAFPDCLPYGGAHAETVPHMTCAHFPVEAGEVDMLRIERQMLAAARPHLPIRARVETASLFRRESGRWREAKSFRLGG
jgi:2'-5' RNA ligase